jgi:undecaprenyl-diphosphatase
MPILHAIVLGITQGLAEFLPISSSGHLVLVPWLFEWDDFNGDDSLQKAFDVALHLGTFVGALAYFRTDIVHYTRAGFGMLAGRFTGRGEQHRADGRIAWLLVLSAVPAALVGALLNSQIDRLDDEIWLIAVALIGFGLLLLWADRLGGTRKLDEFGVRDALVMGAAQAIALQPGASRSGVTITASRWAGFNRDSAARLSFLMSLPIIAGAGLYQFVSVMSDGGIPAEMRGAFVAGMVSAGITGWFAVWATLRIIRTRSFAPFVIYRVGVGVGVLVLLATGVR